MKLLFFSSDGSEVEEVGKEFTDAGIPCEVRNGSVLKDVAVAPAYAELWIENDKDCHRAYMLCVQLGVGFANRGNKSSGFDS